MWSLWRGNALKGELVDGNFQVILNRAVLNPHRTTNVSPGADNLITIVGLDDAVFRGFLVTIDTDETSALMPLDFTHEARLAAACLAIGAPGLTHTNSADKSQVFGSLVLEDAAEALTMWVTIVVPNDADESVNNMSIYYQSSFTLSVMDLTRTFAHPTKPPVEPTDPPVETTLAPAAPAPVPMARDSDFVRQVVEPCPAVPDTGCSVCGEDRCVGNPDVIFAFPGQPSVTCGNLQGAGYAGQIPLTQCPLLPPVIDVLCECRDGPAPVPTPAPVEPAPASVEPTNIPAEPTDPPVDGVPTDPPVDGVPTDPPVDGVPTDPPVDGVPTDPPVDGVPTDPPVDGVPTDPPVDGVPTDPPVETPAPVESTPAPISTAPVSTAPVSTAPVSPAPIEPTPAPVEPTPAPVELTPAPVEATPAPIPAPTDPPVPVPTPFPVESTPGPTNPPVPVPTPAPVDSTPTLTNPPFMNIPTPPTIFPLMPFPPSPSAPTPVTRPVAAPTASPVPAPFAPSFKPPRKYITRFDGLAVSLF
jgi:hypothetical protein